ncbi:signal peptidase I [Halorubrum gandharaense]
MDSDVLGSLVTALLVVCALALVAGQLAGQPVLLGYVTSDSMEPTVSAGDGFVAVPAAVADDPEPGDVVVFEAETLHDGGLTTHRVVDETADGYVTQGDANPFTDQDGGEPPVTDDRIVAHAAGPGDDVVAIPHLGTAVMGTQSAVLAAQERVAAALGTRALVGAQGVGTLLFVTGLALFALSAVGGRTERSRDRTGARRRGVNTRRVTFVLLLVVLIPANAAMVGPSGAEQVVIDGDDTSEAGIASGEPVHEEIRAVNDGLVATFVAVETRDAETAVDPNGLAVASGESAEATLTVPAPPPDEERTVAVSQHRYLLLLPPSVLAALHGVSPVAAWGAINLLVGVSVVGIVVGALGTGRVRDTSRDLPVGERVRRLFR